MSRLDTFPAIVEDSRGWPSATSAGGARRPTPVARAVLLAPEHHGWWDACRHWVSEARGSGSPKAHPIDAHQELALVCKGLGDFYMEVASLLLDCTEIAVHAARRDAASLQTALGRLFSGRGALAVRGPRTNDIAGWVENALRAAVPGLVAGMATQGLRTRHLRQIGFLVHAVRSLLGEAPAGRCLRVPFALVDGKSDQAIPAEFVFEALPAGAGQIVISPELAFVQFRDGFEYLFYSVPAAVKHVLEQQRGGAATCDVRMSVECLAPGTSGGALGVSQKPLDLVDLSGRSATGAAGLGLYYAWTGFVPDKGIAVLARMNEKCSLEPVDAIAPKVKALTSSPWVDSVVVVGNANRKLAEQAVRDAQAEIRIIALDPKQGAANLSRLTTLRSQLADEVICHMTHLAERAAELPSDHPPHLADGAPGTTAFDNVRQVLHVVPAGQGPASAVPWDDKAGDRFSRAVILGGPGSGKTWVLRYEARRLARTAAERLTDQAIGLDDVVFPIHLRLPDLSETEGDLCDAIPELAADGWSRRLGRFVRERLASGQCVVLLDGWDEVEAPREDLGGRLDAFARSFAETKILLTSRTDVCGSNGRFLPDAQVLRLQGLDRSQVMGFIDRWTNGRPDDLAEALDLHEDLWAGVCRAMLAAVFCKVGGERRGDVYQAFLRALIQARSDLYDGTQRLLEELAWRHLIGGGAALDESLLHEVVRAEMQTPALQAREDDLVADLLRTGVVKADDGPGGGLSFLHLALRDYLAAQHLVEELRAPSGNQPMVHSLPEEVPAEQFLQEKADDPAWQETLVFLAGSLPRDRALEMIAGWADCNRAGVSQPGAVRLRRLVLVARCVGELEA